MKFGPQGSSSILYWQTLFDLFGGAPVAGQSVLLRDVHEVERTQQGFRKLPAIHVFYGDRIGAGFLTGILLLIQVFYNSCPARHVYQLSAASSLEYSYVS